jgi:hypothetical protein
LSKVIARIRGGLGNQLFCYAAARRLALTNGSELIMDDTTGFVRDRQYRRRYMLDRFKIPVRKATPSERMEPFERYRRGLAKLISHRLPFSRRKYIEEEHVDFDPRLLSYCPSGTVYLDGLWQSEGYFKDIESIIRQDLSIIPPDDAENIKMAKIIADSNSVSVHVRWFNQPGTLGSNNLDQAYYAKAVGEICKLVSSPHFFLFSDNVGEALAMMNLPSHKVTCIDHNRGDENAYADLWLMSQCKHFIIANSTFSWWGAWLGYSLSNKTVIAPGVKLTGISAWAFAGLLPDNWIIL